MTGRGFADQLARVVGPARVIVDPDALWTYGYDATLGYRGAPAAVAFPASEPEVAALVRLASAAGVPSLARGGATSLAASAVPPDGALVIDTNRLRAVRSIDPKARRARVEPGVVTSEFRALAARHGLFYPPDPSSEAVSTLGGNVATNAGGPSAFKYGVTRDFVTGLRLVTPDGHVVGVARPPDGPLIDLIVGSEGTLGIVTEIELRLLPPPAERTVRAAVYADGLEALRAVPRIIRSGIVPAKLEYLDAVTIEALERARAWGLPADAGGLLLIELDGASHQVARDARRLDGILKDSAAGVRGVGVEQASRWWAARPGITAALARIRPAKFGEDICVPPGALASTVDRIQREAAARGLVVAVFGHVADGTVHPNVLYDPADARERQAAADMLTVLAEAGLAAGGVLSGEHGLGRAKRPFVPQAYDAPTLALMRRLKATFDPAGTFNPGAMWPSA